MSTQSSNFVASYDIDNIPQGNDTNIPINYRTDVPLTLTPLSTYTAKLQARQTFGSPVILELSSVSGTITLADTSPNITLHFTRALLAPITIFTPLIYELVIVATDGTTTPVLRGELNVQRQIVQ